MAGIPARRCFVVLGLLGALAVLSVGKEHPKTMVKVTIRLIEPKPERDSFAAQPRTVWRAGSKYARIAEATDSPHHIHGLMIIDEPQVWMINLYDRSGKHIIDPGPSLDVKIPIFQFPNEEKSELQNLEFGREIECMTAHNTKSTGTLPLGKKTNQYKVALNGGDLTLWVDAKTEKPVRISYSKSGETQAFEYLDYEYLPFDPSLFQPPAGIVLVDAK